MATVYISKIKDINGDQEYTIKDSEARNGIEQLENRTSSLENAGYVTSSGVTKITAGTGLNTADDSSDSATKGSITTTGTLYLTKSGVTAGSYGPTANVTGTNETPIDIPQITVDKYGRVTNVVNRTYTSVNTDVDTKNTTGSKDTTSKIFLVGATSQTDFAETFSDSEVYVQNGSLYLVKAQDLSGTTNSKPALILGGLDTSTHLELDANEIQAKTNGTSTAQLYINNDGGLVTVGSGGLAVSSLTASQAVVTDANKKLVSTSLAVSDPSVGTSGQVNFIATISQAATGKITATKQPIRAATTSQTGIVQLSSAINSTSTTLAATPSAVKQAYDLANTTKYWANIQVATTAAYNAAPEMATIKLNGNTSATAASTSNVTLVFDATAQALNFVFA